MALAALPAPLLGLLAPVALQPVVLHSPGLERGYSRSCRGVVDAGSVPGAGKIVDVVAADVVVGTGAVGACDTDSAAALQDVVGQPTWRVLGWVWVLTEGLMGH